MITENVLTGFIMVSILYVIYLCCIRFYLYVKNKHIPTQAPLFANNSTQEDPASKDIIKRVRAAFEEQREEIDGRAIRAHDPLCADNWDCVKDPCFIWKSDKIVGETVVEKMKNKEQRSEELRLKSSRYKRKSDREIN